MPLTTLYAIEHTAETLGKLISNSKRCIRFRFAAKSLSDSSSSTSLEKQEFDISLIWSINSGKILIICNGEEVRFSEAVTRYPKLDVEWKAEDGTESRLVAYASALALMGEGAERQYDLFVGGRSYFTFPREQDIKPEGSKSDAPPQAQESRMVKSAATLYATGHNISFCGKVIANSKRIVHFSFATGEQVFAITLIWSINSGKALIMCNGQEVRYSSSITTTFPKLDAYWKAENGMEVRLVANASAPRGNGAERQYDLFVGGQSYFTFPHVDMSSIKTKFGDEKDISASNDVVHKNDLVEATEFEKIACQEVIETECSVGGNTEPYTSRNEAVKEMTLMNKAQEDQSRINAIRGDEDGIYAKDGAIHEFSQVQAAESKKKKVSFEGNEEGIYPNVDAYHKNDLVQADESYEEVALKDNKEDAVHMNDLVEAAELNEEVALKDKVAAECRVNGNSKLYTLKNEAVLEMSHKRNAKYAQLQAQQNQLAHQKQPHLTFVFVGAIVAILLVISVLFGLFDFGLFSMDFKRDFHDFFEIGSEQCVD